MQLSSRGFAIFIQLLHLLKQTKGGPSVRCCSIQQWDFEECYGKEEAWWFNLVCYLWSGCAMNDKKNAFWVPWVQLVVEHWEWLLLQQLKRHCNGPHDDAPVTLLASLHVLVMMHLQALWQRNVWDPPKLNEWNVSLLCLMTWSAKLHDNSSISCKCNRILHMLSTLCLHFSCMDHALPHFLFCFET